MSYRRVIPRDLFNDAGLLKSYGQLYLATENYDGVEVVYRQEGEVAVFDIRQNESTGGTFIHNVELVVRGRPCRLERPLNCRGPSRLYLTTEEDEVIEVFSDDGDLSEEMEDFLARPAKAGP